MAITRPGEREFKSLDLAQITCSLRCVSRNQGTVADGDIGYGDLEDSEVSVALLNYIKCENKMYKWKPTAVAHVFFSVHAP